MEAMDLFKAIILVQLFYSFSITGLAYTIPADAREYTDAFSQIADDISLSGVSTDIQNSLEKQTNIPVIELGALVFYSGNLLIDLLLNFAFAIPQMFGMLVNGIMMLISIDSYISTLIQLFATVVMTALYFIGIIQLLTSIRSGTIT